MSPQNEMFDLIREKKELDDFLSAFTPGLGQPSRVPQGSADKGAETAGAGEPGTDHQAAPPEKAAIEKQEKEAAEPPRNKTAKKERESRRRTGILFAIWVVMTLTYLWLYPDTGYRLGRSIASGVPFFDQIEAEKGSTAVAGEPIKLIDVRQRFVGNPILGNIRVVEGLAINRSASPLAGARVVGKLYDAGEAVLMARTSYCGSIVADEKLGSLSEEEIQAVLSAPPGDSLPDGKILPDGHAPFMIVFTREPAGVAKTTVAPLSAETP